MTYSQHGFYFGFSKVSYHLIVSYLLSWIGTPSSPIVYSFILPREVSLENKHHISYVSEWIEA